MKLFRHGFTVDQTVSDFSPRFVLNDLLSELLLLMISGLHFELFPAHKILEFHPRNGIQVIEIFVELLFDSSVHEMADLVVRTK